MKKGLFFLLLGLLFDSSAATYYVSTSGRSGAAGTLDLVQCRVCGHISDGNLTCSRCDREAGRCCARLYHCQSNYCECRLCFRFACEACGACLPDRAYVSDVSPTESTSPYCDACRAIAAENCGRSANS